MDAKVFQNQNTYVDRLNLLKGRSVAEVENQFARIVRTRSVDVNNEVVI
jgi:hypothetical protein